MSHLFNRLCFLCCTVCFFVPAQVVYAGNQPAQNHKATLLDGYAGVRLGTSSKEAQLLLGAKQSGSWPVKRVGQTAVKEISLIAWSQRKSSFAKKMPEPTYNVVYVLWKGKVALIWVSYSTTFKVPPSSIFLKKMIGEFGEPDYTYPAEDIDNDYQRYKIKCPAYGWENNTQAMELEIFDSEKGGKDYYLTIFDKSLGQKIIKQQKEELLKEKAEVEKNSDNINFGRE